jgi:GT2 family glycosyltransferase
MSDAAPRVSVIVPAFRSGATIAASLASLVRQTYRDFEIIVVESSGDEGTAAMMARDFPSVQLVRAESRLLPQAARNHGVSVARGELFAFTDPDIYLAPDWLAALVEAWEDRREVVIGSFACHGTSLVDFGFHLTKFSKWLPAGRRRTVDTGPSGNMLVSRADFERAGGFRGELFLGDVELSRALRKQGLNLWFEPTAVGAHHHLYTVREFCRERFQRGQWYGELRRSWYPAWRIALLAAATILPLRLASNVMHVGIHAWRAGMFGRFVLALPVVVCGYAATLAGEARAFVTRRTAPVDM